eukprot:scaffold122461_cov27-Tisochrysis_lutea.AAC.1
MLASLIERARGGFASICRWRSTATEGRTSVAVETEAKPRVRERDILVGERRRKLSADRRILTGSHVGTFWKSCACSSSRGLGWRRVGYLFFARTGIVLSRLSSVLRPATSPPLPRKLWMVEMGTRPTLSTSSALKILRTSASETESCGGRVGRISDIDGCAVRMAHRACVGDGCRWRGRASRAGGTSTWRVRIATRSSLSVTTPSPSMSHWRSAAISFVALGPSLVRRVSARARIALEAVSGEEARRSVPVSEKMASPSSLAVVCGWRVGEMAGSAIAAPRRLPLSSRNRQAERRASTRLSPPSGT